MNPGSTSGAYAVNAPVATDIRMVNFFNGRLLTAEDLRREQDANLRLRDRLGLAVGEGVVTGLEVSLPVTAGPGMPVVSVSAGVAVNRRGRAVELQRDTLVMLSRRGDPGTASAGTVDPCGGGDFAPCSGLDQGAPLTLAGVHLLTVAPSATSVGRAPVSGLGNETARCATDTCADGVEFRAHHLNLDPELVADAAHLRNRLAHLMFGTSDPRRSRLERDPFGSAGGPYGLVDNLRETSLCADEVPLACILWMPGPGIRFVDQWSVRRRVVRRSASAGWSDAVDERRQAEGEATFLQFQDELAELAAGSAGAPALIAARDRFRHLPAAGLVPLAGSRTPRGFDALRFFAGMTTRPAMDEADPIFIDGARAHWLLRASYAHPPIDVTGGDAVWVYQVRQNSAERTAQSALLFASGFLPYLADGQYDLSRFDFANYALRLA
ncbi:hypothetical protein [Streptomyces sp. NPDC005078]|uniref:hypothetical protein n=1 Tax=unclassified Streptomyces TaxID=2593676 RepID=UPI0033B02BC8